MPPESSLPARGPTLRLVCVNDVYSLENLPRLRRLIEHHAATAPADVMLVTLAGDFLAPSLLSGLDGGRGMVDCLNLVGVTHVTFGNHEDDVPPEELRKRVKELRAVWLNSNVLGFPLSLPSHQVIEVAGEGTRRVRVGLLGVVMADEAIYRRKPFGGCDIVPASAAAQAEAARLVGAEGCACVVPLTHQTLADDRLLARAQRSPPFPVIVGGHEHEVFIEQIDGTWIIKAGSEAAHAAVVDLRWPAEAPAAPAIDLPSVSVRLEDVARYPEDDEVRSCVNRHMELVHQLETATLVKLAPGQTLSSVGTRVKQTSMGALLCSRLRDVLGADACLVNGGGIRAARDYHGHFTYGDLKAEVPFDNELVVVRMPGRVLREAVAASRARAPVESGAFLQVDDRVGVEEPGHLVVSVGGEPLDPERDYRVAVIRDLLLGLDHIEPLARFARQSPDRVPPAGSGRGVRVVLVDAFSLDLWRQLGGFDAIDTNHDERIDAAELAAAIGRATAESPSPLVANLVLQTLDTDHDQLISRQEAEAADEPDKG